MKTATDDAQPAPSPSRTNSYRDILKMSALIGSSSAASIVIGMVRTKAIAVLLGPAGFGLMSLYMAIADLARSVVEMGINSSGVRQIAAAAASGESARVARVSHVLRRVALGLGLLGAALLIAASKSVSLLTFGTEDHATGVALLSLAVLLRLVADGQAALLQGLRRIPDLAKLGILGSLFGTVAAIPIIYVLREDGVVPSIVIGAALSALTAWWYGSKVSTGPTPALNWRDTRSDTAELLRLGVAFMVSGLLMVGAAYVVRLILANRVSIEAAGLFQSSWTLGGLYVGFILQAMGTDFYPRLVGVANEHPQCNQLVNEQAHVSLLLAGPGVLVTIVLASPIIHIFYSSQFEAAIPVLRWICLGMALRVLTWPMGYIIVAKGAQGTFIACELAWTVVYVGLTWFCVKAYGLEGAGIAFFASYVFHGLLIYPVVRHMSGFRWSRTNLFVGLRFLMSIAAAFLACHLLPALGSYLVGLVIIILSTAYSTRSLLHSAGTERVPARVLRLLTHLRLTQPAQSR